MGKLTSIFHCNYNNGPLLVPVNNIPVKSIHVRFLQIIAPVIRNSGRYGAGDSGDIAGLKCLELPPMSPDSVVDVTGY